MRKVKIYKVGGAVRDELLGIKPHDCDYVVFGADIPTMLGLGYKQVGKDFPVFLHPQTKEEYALARTERKIGDKHTSFAVDFGPAVTPQEDVARRDFTCNALLQDVTGGKIIDLVGGRDDIKNKILRHVNSEHFIEDPLRVLRMCRFAAKLNFMVAPETMKLAQQMVQTGMLVHLTAERVWKEFAAALETANFDIFILLLRECGALKVILPEVEQLFITPERLDYHPEGNSGTHTILALRKAAKLAPQVKFALLLHDIGKIMSPTATLPHHHGHDMAGLPLIEKICRRLCVPNNYRKFALLVAEKHMKFRKIFDMRPYTFIVYLEDITKFKYQQTLEDLIAACRCDLCGRGGTISSDELLRFEQIADFCRCNFAIQAKVKAADMPNFQTLPKNAEFLHLLREYRTQFIVS